MRPFSLWMTVLYLAIIGASAALTNVLIGSWIPGLAVGLVVAIVVISALRFRRPAPRESRPTRGFGSQPTRDD